MRVLLALVVLGGLLYLEALRGWLRHRAQRFDRALRELAWTSAQVALSADRLASTLQASQHAWGNAVDIMVRSQRQEPWHYHWHVDR